MANLLFAENMRCLRALNGLKQADMLEELGYKQSTWNGYERGASSPNLDDLIRISDFFGILESDLLRTRVDEADINQLYNNYIAKKETPGTLDDAPRSPAFLQYYNTMEWTLFLAVKGAAKHAEQPDMQNAGKKKGRGLHYTNEDPSIENKTDTARIARLEKLALSMKELLEQFSK